MVEVDFTQASYTVSEDVGVFAVCVEVRADYTSTHCPIEFGAYTAVSSQSRVAGEPITMV